MSKYCVLRVLSYNRMSLTSGTTGIMLLGYEVLGAYHAMIGHPRACPGAGSDVAGLPTAGMPASYGGGAGVMSMATSPGSMSGGAGGGAVSRLSAAPSSAMPLLALTPFIKKWTVRVRVTYRGDVKTFKSRDGRDGQLLKLELADSSGELGAVLFGEAIRRYDSVLQAGSMVAISNGTVKMANKQFSKGREYEITLDERCTITQLDDDAAVPTVVFKFLRCIADVGDMPPGTIVDVVGVVTNQGVEGSITTKKDHSQLAKRDVTLADESGTITMTVWGAAASTDYPPGTVLGCKGVKVGDFGGRTLSTMSGSQLMIDPPTDRAAPLVSWFSAGGSSSVRSLTERSGGGGGKAVDSSALADVSLRSTFENVKDESAAAMDAERVHVIKASLGYVRSESDKLWYLACTATTEAGRMCNKKCTDDAGAFSCPFHGQVIPEPRYIMSANASDHTGSQYLTLFNAEAEAVLGISAKALYAELQAMGGRSSDLRDEQIAVWDAHFKPVQWKPFIFSVKR